MSVSDCKVLKLPIIPDNRGNLSVVEQLKDIPFEIKRAYWLYDVPGGERRAGYALTDTDDFVIAMSGSFDVVLFDGLKRKTVSLNRSYYGLLIPRGIWHEFRCFSTNSLALVVSSDHFHPEQYIRSIERFKALKSNGKV